MINLTTLPLEGRMMRLIFFNSRRFIICAAHHPLPPDPRTMNPFRKNFRALFVTQAVSFQTIRYSIYL